MKKKNLIIISATAITLTACASTEQAIVQHVSPSYYDGLSCNQLNDNARSNNRELEALKSGKTSRQLGNVGAGVFAFVFPPAAFLIESSDISEEVAALQGKAIALQQASKNSNCSLIEIKVLQSDQ